MANVLHPHINFHPRPVSHAPSPFGFGFGLGPTGSSSMSSTGWGSATPGHTNPAAFQQLATSVTQSANSSRPQKRRLEHDEESEGSRYPTPRDESMDRSPTPERPKRAAPKRARVVNPFSATSKEENLLAKDKHPHEEDDVDIGVLIASLPPQSLLPILAGLLKAQPSLKSTILPLIPRPSAQEAIEALKKASQKLHEKYPYSSGSVFSSQPLFCMPQPQPAMRDEYILSRIRPHVVEFVSTCVSYLPYFSYKPPSSQSTNKQSTSSSPLQSMQHDKFQPAETFRFLADVTKLISDHQPLMISELEPLVLPRLTQEWETWLKNLDHLVNRDGFLLSVHVVRSWEVEIEKLGDSRAQGLAHLMRTVLQHYPLKEGWENRLRGTPPMQF
ncbi:unnamed protein product [Cyclocybe aegerita]|uniref:Tethering factor for nuclear proteasome STS1 n=1 Tax=Cyclocybe aegerita TaxID=1973307 RepID=A0A8S0W128_CYCAE|nr:unnamed protein product [Cyclocybe aegerita]